MHRKLPPVEWLLLLMCQLLVWSVWHDGDVMEWGICSLIVLMSIVRQRRSSAMCVPALSYRNTFNSITGTGVYSGVTRGGGGGSPRVTTSSGWHPEWKCNFGELYIYKNTSYDVCLEERGEIIENCSVLYCVLKLCTVISTLRWAVLTVLWIGFCLIRLISLCVDYLCLCVFVFFFVLYCIVVVSLWAQWGGPDVIEA